jgi:phage-related protein
VQEKWRPVIKQTTESVISTVGPQIQIAISKVTEGYKSVLEAVSPHLEKVHGAVKPHLEVNNLGLLIYIYISSNIHNVESSGCYHL